MSKQRPPSEDDPIPPATSAGADRSRDRHKPRKTISLTPELYAQLQALADRNDRPILREARRIFIAALTLEGLWPPPDPHPENES